MKLHVILGATGVGKTDRSVALAQRLRVPVITIDRFQIFEGLATGTGRSAPAELAGTERIYLTSREVAEGELAASDAYEMLERLLEELPHREVILEGGSISLCLQIFERGLLDSHPHEVEYLTAPAMHEERIRRRVRKMLAPPDGQASLGQELARVWDHPEKRAFVETICGYDALARWCDRVGIAPGELAESTIDPGTVEEITASHLDYATRQTEQFERLVRGDRTRGRTRERPRSSFLESARRDRSDLDLVAPARLEDPYEIYARLRREAPVFYSAKLDAWLVSRYEDVATVLKDPERFSSAGVLKVRPEPPPEVRAVLAEGIPYVPTLLDNDPPGHARFRNLVNKAFAPQRVQALEQQIYAIADDLIAGFVRSGGTDLMERFAFPLPIYVIAGILGLPREDVPELKRWCDDWMALQSGTASVDELVSCARNYLRMQRYFIQKIDERTHAAADDLISALIQARVEDEAPLSRDELVRLLMSLLVAGHETTTHSIGNTLVLLLENPSQFELLRTDTTLAAQCFEEGVRMDPAVQSLFRRVTSPVVLRGVEIAAGARVMVLYGSANRDESHYDEPDRFMIRRPSAGKHLGFGKGVHFCLGASMARLEGRIALERLSQQLPGMRLDGAQGLERLDHFFLRGYRRLPATWDAEEDRGRDAGTELRPSGPHCDETSSLVGARR
jgi:cytochrome P450